MLVLLVVWFLVVGLVWLVLFLVLVIRSFGDW